MEFLYGKASGKFPGKFPASSRQVTRQGIRQVSGKLPAGTWQVPGPCPATCGHAPGKLAGKCPASYQQGLLASSPALPGKVRDPQAQSTES